MPNIVDVNGRSVKFLQIVPVLPVDNPLQVLSGVKFPVGNLPTGYAGEALTLPQISTILGIDQLKITLSLLQNGTRLFPTKAAMLAYVPTAPTDSVLAYVFADDTEANNGTYYWDAEAETPAWVKSENDFFLQAKNYTDAQIATLYNVLDTRITNDESIVTDLADAFNAFVVAQTANNESQEDALTELAANLNSFQNAQLIKDQEQDDAIEAVDSDLQAHKSAQALKDAAQDTALADFQTSQAAKDTSQDDDLAELAATVNSFQTSQDARDDAQDSRMDAQDAATQQVADDLAAHITAQDARDDTQEENLADLAAVVNSFQTSQLLKDQQQDDATEAVATELADYKVTQDARDDAQEAATTLLQTNTTGIKKSFWPFVVKDAKNAAAIAVLKSGDVIIGRLRGYVKDSAFATTIQNLLADQAAIDAGQDEAISNLVEAVENAGEDSSLVNAQQNIEIDKLKDKTAVQKSSFFPFIVRDAKNALSLGVFRNGTVKIPNLIGYTKSAVTEAIQQILAPVRSSVFPFIIRDAKNAAALVVLKDGTTIAKKLAGYVKQDLFDATTKGLKRSFFAFIVRDAKGAAALVVNKDGSTTIRKLNGYATLDDLSEAGGGYNFWKGVIWICVCYGQSNNRGTGASALTTTPPYANNFMLNNTNNLQNPADPRYPYGGDNVNDSGYLATALAPLKESSAETQTTVSVSEVTRAILDDRVPAEDLSLAGLCGGSGGRSIEMLSVGSPETQGWFERLFVSMTALTSLITARGKEARVLYFAYTQGEADYSFRTSYDDYRKRSLQLLSDFSTQAYATTGHKFEGLMIVNQCCAMRSYIQLEGTNKVDNLSLPPEERNYYVYDAEDPTKIVAVADYNENVIESIYDASYVEKFRFPYVSQVQLDLALTQDRYRMTYPDYINERVDGIHYIRDHATRAAAYHRKPVMAHIRGEVWKPLHIINAQWATDHILLTYHVPYGNLVIDTTQVAETYNMGFDVWVPDVESTLGVHPDDAAIGSVEVVAPDQIRINFAEGYTLPDVEGIYLTYAWGRLNDQPQVAGPTKGPRGNIRDTHGLVDIFTNQNGVVLPLHNFAAVQHIYKG